MAMAGKTAGSNQGAGEEHSGALEMAMAGKTAGSNQGAGEEHSGALGTSYGAYESIYLGTDLLKTDWSCEEVLTKEAHETLEARKSYKGVSPIMKSSLITENGGSISIDGTGVKLIFPPACFKKNEKHIIHVAILPHDLYKDSAQCFEDHSTVMVEILPNGLILQKAAMLLLPHCLQLENAAECTAYIFESHHDRGKKPQWEDVTNAVSPVVTESACEIKLRKFCTILSKIRGKVVAKKLMVYAVAEPHLKDQEVVKVTVGYHIDLPGADEIYKKKLKDNIVGDYQSLIFVNDSSGHLNIKYTGSDPHNWTISQETEANRVVSFCDIEYSNERHFPFTFYRIGTKVGLPVFYFKVWQDRTILCISIKQHTPNELSIQIQSDNKNSVSSAGISRETLADLSGEVTNWKVIGRHLGVKESTLDSINMEQNSVQERAFQMLLCWKRSNGPLASIDTLANALTKSGRADLAHALQTGKLESSWITEETKRKTKDDAVTKVCESLWKYNDPPSAFGRVAGREEV